MCFVSRTNSLAATLFAHATRHPFVGWLHRVSVSLRRVSALVNLIHAGVNIFMAGYLTTSTGTFEISIGNGFSRRLLALMKREDKEQDVEKRRRLRERRKCLQHKVS